MGDLSLQFTLPWGPFILPRSGRSASMINEPVADLEDSVAMDICCDEGIQAEQGIDRHGMIQWRFACPELCCGGLHLEFEVNSLGLTEAGCTRDDFIDQEEAREMQAPLDDVHLLETLLSWDQNK